MKFDKDFSSQFCKGALLGNFNSSKLNIKVSKVDLKIVERVNDRVLITVRQHEIERCRGIVIAAQSFIH